MSDHMYYWYNPHIECIDDVFMFQWSRPLDPWYEENVKYSIQILINDDVEDKLQYCKDYMSYYEDLADTYKSIQQTITSGE